MWFKLTPVLEQQISYIMNICLKSTDWKRIVYTKKN